MKKLEIIDDDITAAVLKKTHLKNLKLKESRFEVHCKIDSKVYDRIKSDLRFLEKVHEHARDLFKELVEHVANALEIYDDLAAVAPLDDQERKRFYEGYKALCKKYDDKIKKSVKRDIDGWRRARKDIKRFSCEVTADYTSGTLEAAAGSTAIAVTIASGTLPLVLAIIAIGKGVAKIARTVHKHSQSLADTENELKVMIDDLQTAYVETEKEVDEIKSSVGRKEVAKSILAAFTAIHATSITRAKEKLRAMRAGVARIHVESENLGRELSELLEKQDELGAEIQKIEAALKKRKSMSRERKLRQKRWELGQALEETEEPVQVVLISNDVVNLRLNEYEASIASIEHSLAELDALKPGWAKLIEGVVWLGKVKDDLLNAAKVLDNLGFLEKREHELVEALDT